MKFNSIGVMSGTSLDGIDIAYCIFEKQNNSWHNEIKYAKTYPYNKPWIKKLITAEHCDALTFNLLHVEYGKHIGTLIKEFINQHKIKPDFIASHGHTIFHQPENHLSVQIGSGAAIAAECGITTICDFRSLDVALQGQGAPLVPIGDDLLFGMYDACLNIGGISNISYRNQDKRIAFDISPANMVLNYLANDMGYSYDKNGNLAKSGNLNLDLFNTLNKLEFYHQLPPKSLGREWFNNVLLPLMNSFPLSTKDKLHTLVEHIAYQIGSVISFNKLNKVLITGGGAKNKYLIQRIQTYTNENQLIIPDEKLIDYKEALLFAFLGLLRIKNINNCLKSVTGASKDNCGGCIYLC